MSRFEYACGFAEGFALTQLSNARASFFELIVLIGLCVPVSAQAASAGQNECAGRSSDIIRLAYPGATNADDAFLFGGATITLPTDDNVDGDPRRVICRIWPAQPQLTLVAVPLMTEQSESENEGDIELLVIDSTNLHGNQLRP